MAEVLIGCKLPNGLILELITEPPRDRAQQLLQPAPTGARVTLKGSNSLRTEKRASQGEHLFAITRVDKAFWDQWLARNSELAFVKTGLVFVANSERDAQAIGKERHAERTGMEALNMKDGDPRLPKGPSPQTTVEADPESLKPRAAAA